MPRWIVTTFLVLGSSAVWALDITSCNQTVASGEAGVLQADLGCQPGDAHAVALEDRASLDLNGHTIDNPGHFAFGAAIRCFGRCTVVGPGQISGAPAQAFDGIKADAGVFGRSPLRLEVRDLTIDATHIAIEGNVGRGATLRATNVVLTNAVLYGV